MGETIYVSGYFRRTGATQRKLIRPYTRRNGNTRTTTQEAQPELRLGREGEGPHPEPAREERREA